MRHRKLLLRLVALLVIASGGVFALVTQDTKETALIQDSLLAGMEVAVEQEDVDVVEEPKINLQPKPAPQPASESIPIVQSVTESSSLPPPAGGPEPQPAPEPATSPSPIAQLEPSPPPPPLPSPLPSSPPPPAPQVEEIVFVNINTAILEELDQITGVGSSIAQSIIDYRNINGFFQTIDDIKNVSGIADAKFEKMKNEITVGDIVAQPSPAPTPTPPSPLPPPAESKININTASYEELQEITGVGEVIAQRIIDYRNENGLFAQIEDIKNVKGIGEVTFEKMTDEITI